MARTRRSRQATNAPVAAAVTADSDAEQQAAASTRGRTRATRSAISKRQESADSSRSAISKRQECKDSTAVIAGSSRAPPPASSVRNASIDSVEIGRRAAAALETPSILRRDTTGLDLADDSVFGNLEDSFADGDDDDARPRSGSTTRSWSHFKPRSRQSSFIGRNDPPIRPSSRSGAAANSNASALTSSFNIGAFRRRAREPSILGTVRRGGGPRSETSGRGAQSDLESEGEDMAPDAESTPLHNRRRTRASLAAATDTAQRRDIEAGVGAAASAARTTRKRKSEAAAEEEDEAEAQRAAKASRIEATDSDSEISELDSPQMPPSTPIRQRQMTPINLDEINAPPASSGSEDEGAAWPDIHMLSRRRRRRSFTTPLRAGAGDDDDEILSDISSPPSLTHSPNFNGRGAAPRGRAAAAHQRIHEPKPLTTADLANLLPKRRYKKSRRGEDGSDEEEGEERDEDEDEERGQEEEEEEEGEEVAETRTRGGRISRPPSRAASASGTKQQQQHGRTRSATNKKTYGGRGSSDKENGSNEEGGEDEDEEEGSDSQFRPLADDTFGDSTTAAALDFQSVDELKRATRKFNEVDKWQLEYEEVAESFSPRGAR